MAAVTASNGYRGGGAAGGGDVEARAIGDLVELVGLLAAALLRQARLFAISPASLFFRLLASRSASMSLGRFALADASGTQNAQRFFG